MIENEMSREEYQKLLDNQKTNKYRVAPKEQRTAPDGKVFHSKYEMLRYLELLLLLKAGEITRLVLQPSFELQESFRYDGKTIRAIKYIADFRYSENPKGLSLSSPKPIIEEAKGYATDVFAIKRKMFLKLYGDRYELRIV